MDHLYISCELADVDALRARFAGLGADLATVGESCGWPVLGTMCPRLRLLEETRDLLLRGRLRGAAVSDVPLDGRRLALVVEMEGRMAFSGSAEASARMLGPMLVFDSAVMFPDASTFRIDDGAKDLFGRLRGRIVAIDDVLADPWAYYGRFALPEAGGASALFAAGREAAAGMDRSDDRIFVGAAEALGFQVDDGAESVVGWQSRGVIQAAAFGFQLPCTQASLAAGGFDVEGLDRARLADEVAGWIANGLRFGVALTLRGLRDPPVVIPMGSVYQQPTMGGGMQNLAVAMATNVVVGAGQTVPLILPAWCLNRSLAPPDGPLAPTALVTSDAGGPQTEVWDRIATRYGGRA